MEAAISDRQQARGRTARLGFIVLFVLLLALAAVVALAAREAWLSVEEGWHATFLSDQDVDQLVEDQELIASLEVFAPTGSERDAGELLNRYLALAPYCAYCAESSTICGYHPTAVAADEVPWWASGELARAIKGRGWLEEPKKAPRGDMSVLASLAPYDHWELTSSGAFARVLEDTADAIEIEGFPASGVFRTLVKLRIAKGLREKKPLPALREVRKLSQLMYSTERLIEAMVALELLNLERAGYEVAVQKELMAPGDWTPVSENVSRRVMRRVLFNMSRLVGGYAADDAWQRLDALDGPLFGVCSAARDGFFYRGLRRSLLVSPWPLEKDYSSLDRAAEQVLASDRCRLPRIRRNWSAEPLPAATGRNRNPWQRGATQFLRLPYVRSWHVMEPMTAHAGALQAAARNADKE